jgi:hypothetical protein
LEEEKSLDKEYKSFDIERTTKKWILERIAPLPTVRECWLSLSLFGGVFECPVHPFGGAPPFSEQILGLLRQIRENPSIHEGGWIQIDGQGMILGNILN